LYRLAYCTVPFFLVNKNILPGLYCLIAAPVHIDPALRLDLALIWFLLPLVFNTITVCIEDKRKKNAEDI